MSTRRQILRRLAAAPWTLAACTAFADESRRAPIIDTHLHCFAGKGDSRFPYHADAPYRPEAAASPEHLLQCMDGAGVDFAVVVHPEPYQDDHRYLEHCLKVGKHRLQGACLFFAHKRDAVENMKALAKRLPLTAARIHAYAPERLPPFEKPELRTFWKSAVELGLALQLHFEPRYAAGFEPLVREFKDGIVLVDHLGRPLQGTPAEHDRVIRWADLPNVIMKLSAVPKPTMYPHRDVQPVVKRLTNAFGADRLMYGGGFDADATPASYRAERDRVRGLISHLTQAEQAKVLGGTAARLFKLSAS